MQIYKREINPKNLPFNVRDCRKEMGLVKSAIMKCPGVYFLHTFATADHYTGSNFYIVTENAPISAEARAYGKKLATHPELLLYQCEGEDYGYKVIEYEIMKFYIKNDLPYAADEDIHSFAAFGMEVCPSYFGTFPTPMLTPWGYTTRYKVLHPGVFWIETAQCVTTVAVSNVMRDDVSDEVYNLSVLTQFDQEHGIEQTMGYFFFQEKDMALIIFELMQAREEEWAMVDKAALMNAIWTNHPTYAMKYNSREEHGGNDHFGLIMRQFDPSYELAGSADNMITLSPDSDTVYFRFEKQKENLDKQANP